MLATLKKINFKNFLRLLKLIFERFPLPALFSSSAFIIMLLLIRFESDLSQATEEVLLKAFITLVISFFFGVACYLYAEGRGVISAKKHYYQLATLAFAGLFYYFFDKGLFSNFEAETAVYIIITIIGVTAFLFIAKYFDKACLKVKSQREFYVWSYGMFIKILMSAIVGIVAMLLGFIAISSVFTLFDIEFLDDDKWYGYWAAFSLVLFAPFFLLANVPRVEQLAKSIKEVAGNKFFSFLINFVGLPAIFIYFFILYAYTAKVLLNFSEWPQGEVTWMVILFSFFGYLIYFAAFAFRERFKHAEIYRKVLPYAVLLQTPMLFYAIGLRINQYDLTINRYLVVIFGLWLLFLSLYYIISKKKDLSLSFYSLFVVVIFMSIGPWSVYLVPEWRQLALLENNLFKAKILQGSEIIPLSSTRDIEAKLSGEIYGGIEYLCNYHGCEVLDPLFRKEIEKIRAKDFEDFIKQKQERLERAEQENDQKSVEIIKNNEYKEIGNWEIIRELSLVLKVEKWNSYNFNRDNLQYLSFENDTRLNYFNPSIEVSGYDYYISMSNLGFKNNINDEVKNQYYAAFDSNEANLRLFLDKTLVEEIDVQTSIIDKILDNEDNYIEPEGINPSLRALLPDTEMTFDLSTDKFDYRINLQSISIKNPDWKDDEGEFDEQFGIDRSGSISTTGYILLRKKIDQ